MMFSKHFVFSVVTTTLALTQVSQQADGRTVEGIATERQLKRSKDPTDKSPKSKSAKESEKSITSKKSKKGKKNSRSVDTVAPSAAPTTSPSDAPSSAPSDATSASPSVAPSSAPSAELSVAPSTEPSVTPSDASSAAPTSVAPSVAPSAAPSLAPSAAPSPEPSPAPSPGPSPSPTSTCVIDIELTRCPLFNLDLQGCKGRPRVITFRYNGGNCLRSNNLQPREAFTCEDSNGGPPTGNPNRSFIQAVATGGSDIYFSGLVVVGDKFTLNQDKNFDKLSANLTIEIFISKDGILLQRTNMHLSCSQPLFLFDVFGANQVTEWTETDGRVVSDRESDVPTGTIIVQLDTSPEAKPVRLLGMQVFTNAQEQPIDYTTKVAGLALSPGSPMELEGFAIDVEYGSKVRYTFFTTIIGETLDGSNQCNGNSFLECSVESPTRVVSPEERGVSPPVDGGVR